MKTSPKKSNGFSLVEILITLVVTSLGLLGAMAMQMTSLKHNQSAQHRTLATLAAYDIIDRMRANNDAALNGGYLVDLEEAPTSGTTLANRDVIEWKNTLANWLPNGDGQITFDATNSVFTITVQWDESRIRSGESAQQFVFQSRVN
jgi:type IV pilus assembly protein PilV